MITTTYIFFDKDGMIGNVRICCLDLEIGSKTIELGMVGKT